MRHRQRRGSVLIVVLVIIVMLALGAYAFTELGINESAASNMFGRGASARAFADSGLDVAAVALIDPLERTSSNAFYNRPDLFAAVLMEDSDIPRGRGRFSVVAPAERDPTGRSVRFGMIDESGKLNVNSLSALRLGAEQTRNMMMPIPLMTVDVADAILDWVDTDATPRQTGAEDEYYSSLPQPYGVANGPLGSIDELLLVRGVTAALLYGEDQNRNGLLDPGEDLNGDGVFDRGWAMYLTVSGAERNVRVDGSGRINVNHENLPELYDQLQAEFGDEAAKFVVAYRMKGAKTASDGNSGGSSSRGGSGNSSGRGGGGNNNSSGNSASGNSSSSGGGNSSNSASSSSASSSGSADKSGSSSSSSSSSSTGGGSSSGGGRGGGNSSGGSSSGGGNRGGSQQGGNAQTVQKGGIDVTPTGSVTITSIAELIGAQAEATTGSATSTVSSPWANNSSELAKWLPQLYDALSTSKDPVLRGRININQASLPVLMGLPGMNENVANAIVASQDTGESGGTSGGALEAHSTIAWLVTQNLVDLNTLKQFERYVTTRGDVFRAQSVGFFDDGGPVVRLDAVIDASADPPQVLSVRDLTDLGKGFSARELGAP